MSFIGDGSNVTGLNASALSSGTEATARLGSGSATSSTFLRGDGTWATAGGGGLTGMSDFTSSSNWTAPANVNTVLVYAYGGGGSPSADGNNVTGNNGNASSFHNITANGGNRATTSDGNGGNASGGAINASGSGRFPQYIFGALGAGTGNYAVGGTVSYPGATSRPGGAGAFAMGVISVTAGSSYSVTVGNGGSPIPYTTLGAGGGRVILVY